MALYILIYYNIFNCANLPYIFNYTKCLFYPRDIERKYNFIPFAGLKYDINFSAQHIQLLEIIGNILILVSCGACTQLLQHSLEHLNEEFFVLL